MMSEIDNLKCYRKQLARAAKEQEAQANRQRFGRSRNEREKSEAEKDRAARQLDRHKRDT
jgi:hypothetical protein